MRIEKISLSRGANLTIYQPEAAVGYNLFRRRPGIILAPGGAYLMHATREKEGVALEFIARGYNVFLLEYSIGFSSREAKESGLDQLDTAHRFPAPLLEMFETIHYVRQNANNLNTDSSRLFLLGFSAGGHLCGSAGVFWNREEYIRELSFVPKGEELKATGMVLCYPMLNARPKRTLEINAPESLDARLLGEFLYKTTEPTPEQIQALDLTRQVTADTVPAFIWHSIDDPVVDATDSTRFTLAMQEAAVNCEYHLFSFGGHGLGLASKTYARTPEEIRPDLAIWTDLADAWMSRLQ